ncbi:hypothetical protein C1H46_026879 [Malus baccata]|uniref:Uncharacterized protein n=1 Tax=Malus baccata TaxID=106549 RepID=A0A540LM78_MALBA|nr:hypothetical protein C1H46_026879 [Malus baccata]
MRTLCDVCESAATILFCAVDEAALRRSCDEKVLHFFFPFTTANPTAQKALLVLGQQASALVNHVAHVDWSLLHQLSGSAVAPFLLKLKLTILKQLRSSQDASRPDLSLPFSRSS